MEVHCFCYRLVVFVAMSQEDTLAVRVSNLPEDNKNILRDWGYLGSFFQRSKGKLANRKQEVPSGRGNSNTTSPRNAQVESCSAASPAAGSSAPWVGLMATKISPCLNPQMFRVTAYGKR